MRPEPRYNAMNSDIADLVYKQHQYEIKFILLKRILSQKGLEKELEKFNLMNYKEKCAAVDRFVKAGLIRYGRL